MRLITALWLLYVLAWFLPVIKEGVTLPDGLPGWQAFRVALSPWWAYEGFDYEPGITRLICPLTALTNLVMLASVLVVRWPARGVRRVLAGLLSVSFLIDAYWLSTGDMRADLRIGFYLWWLSFAALAGALLRDPGRAVHDQRRETPAAFE